VAHHPTSYVRCHTRSDEAESAGSHDEIFEVFQAAQSSWTTRSLNLLSSKNAASLFLPQIRYVRSVLTSRFHPTDVWDRGHWPIQVTGVGFFDFRHGQSGVAPNAIELHPILGVKIGGASSTSPPAPPANKATPKPAPAGNFSVSASVSPNPVSYGQYATLFARSVQAATCTASVLYSTGRAPRSFSGSQQTVGGSGTVSWQWHMESKGSSGTGTVTCSFRGTSKTATASFTVG
jgi:hypothetical protein